MGSSGLYKPLLFGMSSEKQESFLKMSILTTAAILCKYNLIRMIIFESYNVTIIFQLSLQDFFLYFDLKALSMNLILISTIVLHSILQKKDFISFIIGLMIGHGILWVELSEVIFIHYVFK